MIRHNPSFLFHVPGCDTILDSSGHNKYDSNYISLEQLRDMKHKPSMIVDVVDTRSGRRIGSMATSVALVKFG